MDLIQRAQQALDWRDLLELVVPYCSLDATGDWVLGVDDDAGALLASSAEEANARYALTAEFLSALADGESVPVSGVLDCRSLLRIVEQGGHLELHQWTRLRDGILSLQDLHRWLNQHGERYPLMASEFRQVRIDPVVVDTLAQSFDDAGQLSENYYPMLGRLRQKMSQIRSAIDAEVRRLMQDDSVGRHLQENYVTERNGRMVFPMKNSYPKRIGIAHASSRSGETIFVEPISLLPLSNSLQETEFAMEQEVRAILRRLVLIVRPHVPTILKGFYATVRLDLRRAMAVLSIHWRAQLPEVQSEGVVDLKEMRHPLLIDKVEVVPNDFQLTAEQPAIIFSGPNAGGKTIALKSIGIAAWMVRLGVPIPAKRARVDFFTSIIADVGDAQTVQEGLSSFSAHLLMMNEVLSVADAHTLVLLDEIGMGTDPAQGAALAQAIVEQLLIQGSKLVVTTHFTRLKAFAATDTRCAMAAMHIVNGYPTHRLIWGEIGESEALSLATRMDLPEGLVERARGLLDQGERQLSVLVEQLEEQRRTLAEQNHSLQRELASVQHEKNTLAMNNQAWELRKQQLEEAARQSMRLEMQQIERRANDLLKEIRQSGSLKQAARHATEIKNLKQDLQPQPARPDPIPEDAILKVGDTVYVMVMDCSGVIESINGRKVEVSVNGLSMRLNRSELGQVNQNQAATPTRTPRPQSMQRKRSKSRSTRRSTPAPVLRVSQNTCDLRGCRVEEAFDRLEHYFDQQILNGRRTIFILHGHGTGALRTGVRDWLNGCHYVHDWRPANDDEGGDAFTRVELK